MRWKGNRRSTRIEDRRGRGGVVKGGAKLSGGMIVLALIYAVVTGQNPLTLLGGMMQQTGGSSQQKVQIPKQRSAAEQEQAEFSSVIFASTEDIWNQIFSHSNQQYQAPSMVLYEGQVQSRCGINSEAVGPFYCPADSKVYLSLNFFRQLERMGAPGDFARAYVIGHEVGHHIQNITGTARQVRQWQQQAGSKAKVNQLSVMMELQADCLAGVWAHHANKQQNMLEAGDVEEGLRAAASIGDDTIQSRAGREVKVENFTHGSSAQRVKWLKRGLQTGNYDSCNVFSEGA
ncbi:zinc metallopeptidase [Marinicella sp. S1101]|uniref:KPN_02809 family neutral zinc metallopeptidase n=1 Tax=Marinicella marina TaxID=2996016 RepID=UPI002260A1D6|nr:neutral zinc metallopeptidase [Marinicella marina]MCX7552311.1 zinc metallopeptidase [Marinicella marina]MDJ1139186.1 neutral zinc metallopeptidase [Marinicella marina]